MKTIESLLAEVPLLKGLDSTSLTLVAGCASNVHFDQGAMLFRQGDPADVFYAIRQGTIALETFVPARGPVTIETLEAKCQRYGGKSHDQPTTSPRRQVPDIDPRDGLRRRVLA